MSVASSSVSPALQPPPGHPRFPLLDGVRGIAILMVVFGHVSIITGATRASWGWLPINSPVANAIFFALSGFLLYRPFARAHAGLGPAPDVLTFARRRGLRILPAYWTGLTLLALFPGVPGVFSSHWWLYYSFGQIYSKQDLTGGITFAGYICVAVCFYCLLPLLALMAARLARSWSARPWWQAQVVVAGGFALVGPICTALVHDHQLPTWTTYSFITLTDWFAAGMATAVVSVALERRGRTPRGLLILARGWVAWTVAAALFLLAARPFDAYSPVVHGEAPSSLTVLASNLLLGACATMILLPAILGTGGIIRRLLAWRPLTYIGLISYGIYIWHFPLAAWLAGWHGPPDPIPGTVGGLQVQYLFGRHATTLVLFAVTLGASAAVATASYRWIELPFLRRKDSSVTPQPHTAGIPAETA